MFTIIITQILKMLLILLLGVLLCRTKVIDEQTNAKLADLLLLVINPIVTFTALQTDYRPELVRGLLISYALALAAHLIMILISNLLIRRRGNENYAVERFSAMYSNCGFIGIPLVQSILGTEGVLYLTAYLTVFNLFAWTHGVFLMNDHASEESGGALPFVKTLLKNLCTPMIFACVIGLILFGLRIQLPAILLDALDTVGNMNTPLAMIIAGVAVSQTNIPAMLKNCRVYLVAMIKLLLMPAIVFLLLLIIRPDYTVACTILVAAACPPATTCTAFALRFGKNQTHASEMYAFTTLCSLITIPIFVYAAERLL